MFFSLPFSGIWMNVLLPLILINVLIILTWFSSLNPGQSSRSVYHDEGRGSLTVPWTVWVWREMGRILPGGFLQCHQERHRGETHRGLERNSQGIRGAHSGVCLPREVWVHTGGDTHRHIAEAEFYAHTVADQDFSLTNKHLQFPVSTGMGCAVFERV